MATQDKGLGPVVGQTVLYNNAGTIEPGIITAINATGTVSISSFSGATVSARTTVAYDVGLGTSKWAYPVVI